MELQRVISDMRSSRVNDSSEGLNWTKEMINAIFYEHLTRNTKIVILGSG